MTDTATTRNPTSDQLRHRLRTMPRMLDPDKLTIADAVREYDEYNAQLADWHEMLTERAEYVCTTADQARSLLVRICDDPAIIPHLPAGVREQAGIIALRA